MSEERLNNRRDVDDDSEFDMERFVSRESVTEQLLAQVGLLVGGHDLEIASFLLQSLDEHGYLKATQDELATQLDIDHTDVERIRRVLHQLQPPGIAAKDTRECFLIQCEQLESDGKDCTFARRILEEAWDEFIHQRWVRVARKLGVPKPMVIEAWRFMVKNLCPYPLQMMRDGVDGADSFAQADLVICRDQQSKKFAIRIPQATAFDLQLSSSFQQVLQPDATRNNYLSTEQYRRMSDCVNRARLFIAAVRQRWHTLYQIGEYLVENQAEFLAHGPRHLKQMTRTELAKILCLHKSTISRAVSNKTIQLPTGRIIPLRDLFDNSLPAKEAIRDLLNQSSEPLSDNEIAARLSIEGLHLARRTVSKYRESIGLSNRQQHWQVFLTQ
jgi:RNA polymerase sigma-54 factor